MINGINGPGAGTFMPVDDVDGVGPNTPGTFSNDAPDAVTPGTHTGPGLDRPNNVDLGTFTSAAQAVGYLEDHVANDYQSMMIFLHKLSSLMRRQSRETRAHMRDVQMTALHDAAGELRDAATKQMWAGMAMAVATGVAGAYSMRGAKGALGSLKTGAKTLKAQQASLKQTTQAATKGTNAAKAKKADDAAEGGDDFIQGRQSLQDSEQAYLKAQSQMMRDSAKGQIGQALGQMASSMLTMFAEEDRAQQKELEAEATLAESHAGNETDTMSELRDLLKDIQEKLSGIQQARAETGKSIFKA